MSTLIRVLVVDDSPVVRALLKRALDDHPQIEVVGQASDGVDAIQKIATLRPDVVTLDVEMPRMNGIGVLERAAGKVPVGFVMVSTLTQAGARITLEALRKGALDYVTKPETGEIAHDDDFHSSIQQKVLAAAQARHRKRLIVGGAGGNAPKLPPNKERGWIVGIGISCGGPQTLAEMLPAFPSDFVPILVTQHMPAAFTPAFAAQLDKSCAMRCKEAADGEPLKAGVIYLAPGSHHLRVVRRGVELCAQLDAGPKVSGHRPSVDVMFGSMAQVCPKRSIGVIMTGMGNDGTQGIVQLAQAGAWTVGQDEESSLVYGMPKSAAATGCLHHVVPMMRIPHAVARLMRDGARGGASVGAAARG